jgi:hypothetical protein
MVGSINIFPPNKGKHVKNLPPDAIVDWNGTLISFSNLAALINLTDVLWKLLNTTLPSIKS